MCENWWCINVGEDHDDDDGDWHHVAVVVDDGELRVFVDGVER